IGASSLVSLAFRFLEVSVGFDFGILVVVAWRVEEDWALPFSPLVVLLDDLVLVSESGVLILWLREDIGLIEVPRGEGWITVAGKVGEMKLGEPVFKLKEDVKA
ncbi:hypothetical protein DFH28DRAFT_1003880, partial [Melampsora americana]